MNAGEPCTVIIIKHEIPSSPVSRERKSNSSVEAKHTWDSYTVAKATYENEQIKEKEV